MTQTQGVIDELQKKFPRVNFVIKKIITTGDRLKKWPQSQLKGLFVKEIEDALLLGKIDIAVHSMKDLPCEITKGLKIAAITKRIDYRDVLISKSNKLLKSLPKGSIIGTSSLRRKAQILDNRPDLQLTDIRGNLDTRLKKMKSGNYDAIVLAAAGVKRLGLEDQITEFISKRIMLPAPAQGCLGIEIKKTNKRVKQIVKTLHHDKSAIEITAEREFLMSMGGGCRSPLGALGVIRGQKLYLEGAFNDPVLSLTCRVKVESSKHFPNRAGKQAAAEIKKMIRSFKI